MAANAIPNPNVTIEKKKKAVEDISVPLKERATKVLHEIFEGHEEFLGATPD
jgi:hypothetical protein